MSTTVKRTATYSIIIMGIFAMLVVIPAVLLAQDPISRPFATATAEPIPWWQQVERFQELAIKWIGALTIIFGALATLIAFLIAKYQELKGRLDRTEARAENLIHSKIVEPAKVEIVQPANHPVPTTNVDRP